MPKPQLPSIAIAEDAKAFRLAPQINDISVAIQAYLSRTLEADIIGAPDDPFGRRVVSPAAADAAFRVTHLLGEVPRFVGAIPELAATVYASRADKVEWTSSYVLIRCTVANLAMILKVER